jgi:hypothetical protein
VSLPVFGCLAERCVLASEFLGPGKHPKRRRLLTFSISGAKSGVKLRWNASVGPLKFLALDFRRGSVTLELCPTGQAIAEKETTIPI